MTDQGKKNIAKGRIKKTVTRLDKLEKSMEDIQKQQSEVLKLLKNQATKQRDYEEEPGRQPQEEGDIEEEHDKKKELGSKENMTASPDGGDEKLPKAPVGETGEKAKPEGGSVNLTKEDIRKEMEEILKEHGIKKVETPRPQNVQKSGEEGPEQPKPQQQAGSREFVYDLMKKVQNGEMKQADLNREIKKWTKETHDKRIQSALEAAKRATGQGGDQ